MKESKGKKEIDKFSKEYFNKQLKNFIIILIIPVSVLNFLYLRNEKQKENEIYKRLKTNGEIIKINAAFLKHWDMTYAHYNFIARNGQLVERVRKSANYEEFEKEYRNLYVIYNLEDPEEFMEYPSFLNYSTRIGWFFFVFSSVFYAFFLSIFFGFIRFFVNLLLDKPPYLKKGFTPHNKW